jgi:hypothetical protein
MPKVVIRVDAAGEWPVVVDDEQELPTGQGVSYGHVCDVGSVAEGNAVRSLWLRRRLTPEARRWLEDDARDAMRYADELTRAGS